MWVLRSQCEGCAWCGLPIVGSGGLAGAGSRQDAGSLAQAACIGQESYEAAETGSVFVGAVVFYVYFCKFRNIRRTRISA